MFKHFFALCLALSMWTHVEGANDKQRTVAEVEATINAAIGKVKGDSANAQGLITTLTKVKDDLRTKWKSNENMKKIMDIVTSVSNSLAELQSMHPIEIAAGCLELLSGLGETLGPLSGIAPFFSILSLAIGLFGGEKVQASVAAAVKKAPKDQDLEAEIFATQREFTISKAFLDGIRKEPKGLTEMEVASLSANVPIYKGVKFLAILVQKIKNAAPKTAEEAQMILSLMELLADLCSVRDVIILDLYQLVSSAGHSPNIAAGILEVYNVGKAEYRNALQELFRGNNPKHWVLYSSLYPKNSSSQTKKIHKFLKTLGIVDIPRIDDDISGNKTISALAYPEYCMASPFSSTFMQGSYKKSIYKKECTIMINKRPDGFYTLIVHGGRMAYASDSYIFLKYNRKVDKLSKFNFIPVKLGDKEFYIISTCEWSDHYAYEMAMKMGWIAFHKGNPNDSGYQEKAFWKIENA